MTRKPTPKRPPKRPPKYVIREDPPVEHSADILQTTEAELKETILKPQ